MDLVHYARIYQEPTSAHARMAHCLIPIQVFDAYQLLHALMMRDVLEIPFAIRVIDAYAPNLTSATTAVIHVNLCHAVRTPTV